MSTPILYSFWRSSCSWRVRIALHLKKVDYELRTIDIVKKRVQMHEEYKKINPMQRVPALVVDNNTLIESMNIMYYLEENFPGYSLFPEDKIQKARTRELSEIIVSGIQPLQNIGLKQISMLSDEKDFLKFAHHWMKKGFTAAESIARTTAGEFSVGNNVTMADCCLLPQMYNAKKYKLDTSKYPTLERVCTKLEREPSFFLTHPDTQPDCPPRS